MRFLLPVLVVAIASTEALATCPAETKLQSYTTAGPTTDCGCFVPGEQAGAVLTAPADHYPIEIVKVGIGWASQFGGSPASLEQAIHIYAGGLPNPGTPIFTKPGPTLVDGMINLFDLEPEPGRIIVNGGPVTVTLEFLNQNAGGNPFFPSVEFDTDGCQPGKNVVNVLPGGWMDACPLGVAGDWVFWIEYRRANCREASALQIGKAPGGKLQLGWTASCLGTDWDYDIYEGFIGSFTTHTRHTCSTVGNNSATITPNAGSVYYLVVPTDGTTTGTYGLDTSGSERTAGSTICTTQQLCP